MGYTYALELSADEATVKKDGKDVLFDRPVPFYVDNFLNFPVGGAVPVGYYDNAKGSWIPSDNGRVIQILGVNSGLAQLDVTGGGTPADAAALTALGITDAERARLATLYTAGKSLWRMQLTHLSWWDCNWGWGGPAGAVNFLIAAAEAAKLLQDPQGCQKDQCTMSGSVIESQNQTLGEAVDITGAPFALHYRSDRVEGRKAAYQIEIPVSNNTLPPGLKRIDLEINVAGRQFAQSLPAQANQTFPFTWDGQDAYGRVVQGAQPVKVRIGYVYDGS